MFFFNSTIEEDCNDEMGKDVFMVEAEWCSGNRMTARTSTSVPNVLVPDCPSVLEGCVIQPRLHGALRHDFRQSESHELLIPI